MKIHVEIVTTSYIHRVLVLGVFLTTELRDSFAQVRLPPAICSGSFLYFFFRSLLFFSLTPLRDFSALTHTFRTVYLFCREHLRLQPARRTRRKWPDFHSMRVLLDAFFLLHFLLPGADRFLRVQFSKRKVETPAVSRNRVRNVNFADPSK